MGVMREAAFVAVLGLVVAGLFSAACATESRSGATQTTVASDSGAGASGTGGTGTGGSGGGVATQSGGRPGCDGFACFEGRIVVATCTSVPKLCDRRTSGVECVPAGSVCPHIVPEAGIDGASQDGSAISDGSADADGSDGE
jgi:hypothetical protein